jgi:hypothetical protein
MSSENWGHGKGYLGMAFVSAWALCVEIPLFFSNRDKKVKGTSPHHVELEAQLGEFLECIGQLSTLVELQ